MHGIWGEAAWDAERFARCERRPDVTERLTATSQLCDKPTHDSPTLFKLLLGDCALDSRRSYGGLNHGLRDCTGRLCCFSCRGRTKRKCRNAGCSLAGDAGTAAVKKKGCLKRLGS